MDYPAGKGRRIQTCGLTLTILDVPARFKDQSTQPAAMKPNMSTAQVMQVTEEMKGNLGQGPGAGRKQAKHLGENWNGVVGKSKTQRRSESKEANESLLV